MEGDIYTGHRNPARIWQLLHYGLQNLYASDLDEWIVVKRLRPNPGEVTLPAEC